jgi:AcrR family transcriptional regulator
MTQCRVSIMTNNAPPKKNASAVKSSGKNRKTEKSTFIEQARRKQILDTALKLFTEKGFNQTSIDEIAKAVDISRGVIFYYFNGKRELGEETVKQVLRDFRRYVQARVELRQTGKTKLLEYIDASLDYQIEHREDYLGYIDTMGCFGTAEDKYTLLASVNRKTRQMLVELIKSGQKNGDIAKLDANDLADVIQGAIDGLMELCAVEPTQVNIANCKKMLKKMTQHIISS